MARTFTSYEKHLLTSEKPDLYRVRIDRQGYDARGRYWGTGSPLFEALVREGSVFFRAADRKAALAAIKAVREPEAYIARV